ncbi:MAG: hypothetical protein ABL903_15160 [Methylococcales bacterium]
MMQPLTVRHFSQIGLLLSVLSFNPAVQAVHLDVEVWGQNDALQAGFCNTPNIVGCDLDGLTNGLNLPQGSLPIEASSGKAIFLADFQDLPGGAFKTKNPGFQAIQNALSPNEAISYRALGVLKYWPANASAWEAAPANTQITLFGGLDLNSGIFNNPEQCNGQLICFSGDTQGTGKSTVFMGSGIQGAPELLIDVANNQGALHTHLSFFLENAQGQLGGPEGAYLLEMQVFSRLRSTPSTPFLVLFNAGLSSEAFTVALSALVKSVDEPGSTPPIINVPDPSAPITDTQQPVFIQGDADLDGDIDRVDVALILLAAQKNEVALVGSDTRDMDNDGTITRQDATLAKANCTLRLCNIPLTAVDAGASVAPAVFNVNAKTLNIRDVQVEGQHYQVQMQLQPNNQFGLQTAQPQAKQAGQASQYHPATGELSIPTVQADQHYYQVRLRNKGGFQFQVEQVQEIEGVSE